MPMSCLPFLQGLTAFAEAHITAADSPALQDTALSVGTSLLPHLFAGLLADISRDPGPGTAAALLTVGLCAATVRFLLLLMTCKALDSATSVLLSLAIPVLIHLMRYAGKWSRGASSPHCPSAGGWGMGRGLGDGQGVGGWAGVGGMGRGFAGPPSNPAMLHKPTHRMSPDGCMPQHRRTTGRHNPTPQQRNGHTPCQRRAVHSAKGSPEQQLRSRDTNATEFWPAPRRRPQAFAFWQVGAEDGCVPPPRPKKTTQAARQGAEAALVSRGSIVPLFATNNICPQWIGTSNAEDVFLKAQTNAHTRKCGLANVLHLYGKSPQTVRELRAKLPFLWFLQSKVSQPVIHFPTTHHESWVPL